MIGVPERSKAATLLILLAAHWSRRRQRFKHMKSGGRIIMIGSCVGERAMTPGLVAYSATKGAVKMFTQGLSREVGSRGITVNNV
jgi:NAD(P)-dependent dehydrogenase (short-subunit alcohol dehydrogenase family)